MNKTRKILFFDIDGTLITDDGKRYFPDSAKEAIQKARENGHLVKRHYIITNHKEPYRYTLTDQSGHLISIILRCDDRTALKCRKLHNIVIHLIHQTKDQHTCSFFDSH